MGVRKFLISASAFLLSAGSSYAGEGYNAATAGLNELKNNNVITGLSKSSVFPMIAAAILAVGLVFVVWQVANAKPNASKYVISWVVAVIFTLIFII